MDFLHFPKKKGSYFSHKKGWAGKIVMVVLKNGKYHLFTNTFGVICVYVFCLITLCLLVFCVLFLFSVSLIQPNL